MQVIAPSLSIAPIVLLGLWPTVDFLVVSNFLLLAEALHAEVSLSVDAASIFCSKFARGAGTERIHRRSFLCIKLGTSVRCEPSSHMTSLFESRRVIKSLGLEQHVLVFVHLASKQLLLKLSLSAILT